MCFIALRKHTCRPIKMFWSNNHVFFNFGKSLRNNVVKNLKEYILKELKILIKPICEPYSFCFHIVYLKKNPHVWDVTRKRIASIDYIINLYFYFRLFAIYVNFVLIFFNFSSFIGQFLLCLITSWPNLSLLVCLLKFKYNWTTMDIFEVVLQ